MIIKNKIITILWLPGSWKTFFATFLCCYYKRIYANLKMSRAGKPINFFLKNINEIESISFSTTKWVLLIDEWGINVNARNSRSSNNMIFWKLAFLSRKKNIDIIIIWQLERSLDVYFRELSAYLFIMNSHFVKKNYLLYEALIKKINFMSWNFDMIGYRQLDLIKRAKLSKIWYDTLESSLIK